MARSSVGPWFYRAKNTWCIEHFGKRINLRVKGIENESEAVKAWHRFLGGVPIQPAPVPSIASVVVSLPPLPEQRATVRKLIEAFTAAKLGTIKAETHYHYVMILKRMVEKFGNEPAEDLKPTEFLGWLNSAKVLKSGKAFSPTHKNDIANTLMMAYRWAEGERKIIASNPLKNMKKPTAESRGADSVVSPEAHRKILKAVSPELRDLLIVLHATGARPSEICRLTAADVDFKTGIATLKEHKTSHKNGKPRHIVLTADALAVLRRRAKVQPMGALLKNPNGADWKKDTIAQAMRRASARAGVKVSAYDYRHTFATDALSKGIPDVTVAALLGHSVAVLHSHYSHLTAQSHVLKAAAGLVRG